MAVAPPGRAAHRRARRRSSPYRRLRRQLATTEAQRVTLLGALAAAGALAAKVSDAMPTGLDVVDKLWIGGFAAVVAYFAGYARRWTWFVPAGAGALLAADNLAVACAAASVLLAFVSVLTQSRSRPYAAVVVGLAMTAALHMETVAFHGATSLVAMGAVLPVVLSGYRLAGRTARKRIKRVALWSAGGLAVVLAGGAVGVATVASDLVDGARLIDKGILAARDADDDEAAAQLGEASLHLESAESTLTSWFVQPAHAIPFVGPNIRAVSEMTRDTADAAEVSSAAATGADLDQLRFVEGRLDPARIENLITPLENVASTAAAARETADQVGSPWLIDPVQQRLTRLEEELTTNLPDLESALKAVRVAGPLIGSQEDRRYLVLFTTPSEARGRTGFPGNYAELTFQDGQMDMPEFGRIRDLELHGDPSQRTLSGPAEYLARYGRFDPATTWRNIVMSPDFPTVAQVAMELYPQSGGREVDGVLAVDPAGLAALMEFTGPVDVEGVGRLTAGNVESFLHVDQYVTYQVNDQRIDYLEDVAEETFDRLTQADLPKPSEAVDILLPAVEGNHIQFTTRHAVEADYFNEIGVSGALPPVVGDALAVTTTNAGASKIDAFLTRRLSYDVRWDPAAQTLAATARLTLANGAPVEGLPRYLIGNSVGLPPGYNRSFVSIYSPWALEGARIDGQAVALHPQRELSRFVYSTFVDIPPGGEVTVELDLTGNYTGPLYHLALSPAPLVNDEEATVTVDVAGEHELFVEGSGDQDDEDDEDGTDAGAGERAGGEGQLTVDGRTVRWDGLLNAPRELVVSLEDPDA